MDRRKYRENRFLVIFSYFLRFLFFDYLPSIEETYISPKIYRNRTLPVDLPVADTVSIYDSDWNPQNDIQVQSRCHRFGQTKDVTVDRLITRATSEAELFQSASKKLAIDFTVFDANSGDSTRKVKRK
jgi:hypothetical protein